jgi:hypothetical protein
MKKRARTVWMLAAVAGCGMLGFMAPPPVGGPGAPSDTPPAGDRRGPEGEREMRAGEGRMAGRPGSGRVRYEDMSEDELRVRLQQRLGFVKKQGTQITQALAVLERGGDAAEAARVAREGTGDEPRRAPMTAKLSDSDREQIMKLMADHMPELHGRLIALQEANPEAAGEMLERMGGMLLDIVRTKLVDDVLGTARLEELRASWGVLDVVHRIRGAFAQGGEEAAAALKPDLARAIAAQLSTKATLAGIELDRLREQVASLESRATENESLHDQKVNEMAEKLTQPVVLRARNPQRQRGEGERSGDRSGDRPRRPASSSTPNGG